MKYTQEQLEAMGNFELDKIAARLYLPCDYIINEQKGVVELAHYMDTMVGGMHDQVLTPYGEYSPCNNWGDCSALIDQLPDFCINCSSDILHFWSGSPRVDFDICATRKKRALVIAYILVKQEKGQ